MSLRTAIGHRLPISTRLFLSRLLHGELTWQVRAAGRGGASQVVDRFDHREVVEENVALVSAALVAAGVEHVVLPHHRGVDRKIAVPAESAGAVLSALGTLVSSGTWRAVGPDGGTVDAAKVLRRTSVREPLHRLSLFRVLSAPSGRDLTDAASAVVVEGWKLASTGLARADGGEHVEGTRIAPEGNTVVRYLTPSRWAAAQSSPGRWPGSQLARLGDVAGPVDLVYTWVDGADPEWLARKDRALHGVGAGQLNETAVSDSRFASRDELRYSLRSVEMYASWVRNVYIVTDRQVPAWLDTSNPRVRVVDHREIFTDPTRLPVFNSHAIESQLHHIDGLSDRYLYMNDDIFFGRPTSPELFFEGEGLTRFFLSTAVLDLDPPGPRDLPVLSAAKQNRELVERTFGRTITQKFKHTPHPQSRAVLDEMEERFPEIFEAASASRFRHPEDHSIASALHHYYAYATARAVPGDVSYVYQDIARPEAVLTFNRLRRLRDVDVFCLNDTDGTVGSPKERSMVDLLDEALPPAEPIRAHRVTRLAAALRRVVSRPTVPTKPPSLDEIGRALDLDQSSLGHDHLRHYESALEDLGRSPRSIVVVAGRHPRATGLAFARRYPQADVHVLSFVPGAVRPGDPATLRVQPVEDVDGVLDALAGIADIDLLVDDGRHLKSEKRRLLRECLFAVADGGVYAVEDLHGLTIDSMLDVPGEDVLDLVQGIQRRRVDRSLDDVRPLDDETALAAAVRGTVFRPRLLLLTKEGEHLVKLREDAPLEPIVRGRRGEWLEERRVEESFDFPTRVDVTTNRPDLGRHLVESIRVPELRVRTYTGVTVRPRLLRVHDGLVLPETFRLYRHARMKSTQLVDTSQRYAQVRVPDRSAPEPLAGTYYDLDSEHTGTFGHLVTEVVSKLWGWRAAREAHPDLKALVSPSDGTSTLPRWFVDMLDAYGIGEDRIEVLDRPRTVERLVSVTPLFSNPSVVHPRIRETWHDLRDSLLTRSSGLELPRRFFVGRAETLTRQCHNGREVEELFARHGFVKVFPERLSIPDQAALFAGAEAIAGYGGSGMLSSIFTPDDIPRFVISPEGYDAMNEFLIAAAQGGSLHYYYCPADVPRGRSWSSAAYFSDFTFDVEKDGPDLAERLAAL